MARKKSLLLMGKAIHKLGWHLGFNEIVRHALLNRETEKKNKIVKNLIRVFGMRQKRLALCNWKASNY